MAAPELVVFLGKIFPEMRAPAFLPPEGRLEDQEGGLGTKPQFQSLLHLGWRRLRRQTEGILPYLPHDLEGSKQSLFIPQDPPVFPENLSKSFLESGRALGRPIPRAFKDG